MIETIRWEDNKLILLDQTKLPTEVSFFYCTNYKDVIYAIKNMVVRGAPAIGVAAAFGMVLAVKECRDGDLFTSKIFLKNVSQKLASTRPTAVNLFWALERIDVAMRQCCRSEELYLHILEEAYAILKEDIVINKRIGTFGAELIPQDATILTHCNAGAFATGGYGTALGVIRAAKETGKNISVIVDETRPLLQGARLTTFELMQDGIPVTLITDSMAGYVMKKGLINLVVVGADRITAWGDVANKIGTYSVAVLAKEHGIPFYVAAPTSTFDLSLESGEEIPIEERDAREIREIMGCPTAPVNVQVFNPAFDVTPHHLVSAIITELGVIKKPDKKKVQEIVK
ncbi:MAG: S-methyl-5-thioribose-1-phosphate isomerase [Bacillota bacterium]|jgi:methylthioribose-1-phosphate isomerase